MICLFFFVIKFFRKQRSSAPKAQPRVRLSVPGSRPRIASNQVNKSRRRRKLAVHSRGLVNFRKTRCQTGLRHRHMRWFFAGIIFANRHAVAFLSYGRQWVSAHLTYIQVTDPGLQKWKSSMGACDPDYCQARDFPEIRISRFRRDRPVCDGGNAQATPPRTENIGYT